MSSRTSPQNIGSLTQSTSKNGSLSQSNPQDVIVFEVLTPITLKVMASRYVLFGSSGIVLAVARDLDNDSQLDSNEIFAEAQLPATDTNVKLFEQSLNPGRYFIEYDATQGNSYQVGYFSDLVVSGGSGTTDNAGNNLTTAYNIGSLSGSRSFSDFVGGSDTNDYYRFTLNNQNNFSLTLNGLSADADVKLLNSSGGLIADSRRSGTNNESISRQLDSGTYYIQVFPYETNSTNYSLSVSANAVNPNINPNPVSSLTSPIYRFQNSSQPGTYLFAGADEGQNVLRNFRNFRQEGFAFAVGVSDNDSLMPMYRFQNLSRSGTYLYVGAQERDGIINNPAYRNTFREEGVAFYVLDSSTSGGTPFYRFQNTSQPGTYLFVGEQERQGILNNPGLRNFKEEGIAFRVSGNMAPGTVAQLPSPEEVASNRNQYASIASGLPSNWYSRLGLTATDIAQATGNSNYYGSTEYFVRSYTDLLNSGTGTGGLRPTGRDTFVFDPMISSAQGL